VGRPRWPECALGCACSAWTRWKETGRLHRWARTTSSASPTLNDKLARTSTAVNTRRRTRSGPMAAEFAVLSELAQRGIRKLFDRVGAHRHRWTVAQRGARW